MTDRGLAHSGLAGRYPAECQRLGTVFDDTTNSYKLFWFLALLSRLPERPDTEIAVAELVLEMHVQAWHPVTLFRLSLGLQDNLQVSVHAARGKSPLKTATSLDEVRRDPAVVEAARRSGLARYVPFRFLSPWFADEIRGVADAAKNARIRDASVRDAGSSRASPYCFPVRQGKRGFVVLDERWHAFLTEHRGILEGFARHHLVAYLQARNPGVPGIVDKLDPPLSRDLGSARRFWAGALGSLRSNGNDLRDPFSGAPLGESFSLDHFLPWSFVAHDRGWNLCPVNAATNSSKSDSVPDLDRYLPSFAHVHHRALAVAKGSERLLQDHCEAFRLDMEATRSLTVDGLVLRLRDVMAPQVQIAMNLGFSTGWIYAPKNAGR
jgi:hypothetical protein